MWSGETDGTVLVSTQSETYGEFFVTHLMHNSNIPYYADYYSFKK